MTLPKDASQADTTTAPATPASNEQLEKWLRTVAKRLRKLERAIGEVPPGVILSEWISEAFQKISDVEERENGLVDEAIDKAERAQRATRRLKKEFDNHEHEE
jgi:hypothetical protein